MPEKSHKINTLRIVVISILFLSAGFIIGNNSNDSDLNSGEIKLLRDQNTQLQFTRPLIGIDITTEPEFPDLIRIKEDLDVLIQTEKVAAHLNNASIYVRTLTNAHWLSINDKEKYSPGSLLKVPIMMAYFKLAETNPTVLTQKIFYHKNEFKKLLPNELASGLTPNTEYSAEELIKAMIVESDNIAKDLLLSKIDQAYLIDVFSELGVPLSGNESDKISSRVYASFFRRLYNSTFLNADFSEKALSLLNQTSYRNGIRAGVPEKVPVAHKYGERGVYDEQRNLVAVELHDCGILYAPRQDILLCVMTEGSDIGELENVIKKVSTLVYNELGK